MGDTNRGAKVRHKNDDLEVSWATAGVGVGNGMGLRESINCLDSWYVSG